MASALVMGNFIRLDHPPVGHHRPGIRVMFIEPVRSHVGDQVEMQREAVLLGQIHQAIEIIPAETAILVVAPAPFYFGYGVIPNVRRCSNGAPGPNQVSAIFCQVPSSHNARSWWLIALRNLD